MNNNLMNLGDLEEKRIMIEKRNLEIMMEGIYSTRETTLINRIRILIIEIIKIINKRIIEDN